jgi:hypothetical protein
MKSLLTVICALLTGLSLSAQSINKAISGQVKDIQNETVPGATVQLRKATDSGIIQTKTTNNNGRFEFANLPNGSFLLTITAVGNKPYTSSSLTIDDRRASIQLPAIILLPNKKTDLKEVIVTAKKPLIEQDIDKTVVNVEAMVSAATSNTLEVLEKTPGVTVDANGEISLNGRGGVLVLIEGRPTYMSGQDLAGYLRSLPGGTLDKIELMTNPPAKYDAAGSAVINIKLKRSRTQGYTGSTNLSYSQGFIGRSYNSLNLNYLNKKVNLFGNFSYGRYADYNDEVYNRAFYSDNNAKAASVNLGTYGSSGSNEYMGRIGMDYTLSSKTTIGVIGTVSTRRRKDWQGYESDSYNGGDVLDSTGTGTTQSRSTWRQLGANVNLQHKFDNKGKELSADLNYINYNSSNQQDLENFIHMADGSPKGSNAFLYSRPANVDIYTGRADYTHPLANKMVLSAGIKSSIVNNDNVSDYFTVSPSTSTPDYGKSNHFIYRENINAAYVNGRKDWKRIGVQLGLRLENTQTKGNQLGNAMVAGSVFTRDYTSLFPTAFISYKLDSLGKHTISANYARRIMRPGYQQLNPFLFFVDQYTYSSGNPYLTPAYNNYTEVSYRYKQFLNIAVQYDRITDGFSDATHTENNIFINRAENISTRYLMAIMANINYAPTKWWNFNLNLAAARFVTKGQLYTESLDLKVNARRLMFNNQFKFNNDWSAEVSGQFTSRLVSWQRIAGPRSRVGLAIQKKILKSKGSLKLSAEDIFHGLKNKETFFGLKQATAYRYNFQDTRRFGFSFSYSFGKETFARKRKYNDNGADDVKGRVE